MHVSVSVLVKGRFDDFSIIRIDLCLSSVNPLHNHLNSLLLISKLN